MFNPPASTPCRRRACVRLRTTRSDTPTRWGRAVRGAGDTEVNARVRCAGHRPRAHSGDEVKAGGTFRRLGRIAIGAASTRKVSSRRTRVRTTAR